MKISKEPVSAFAVYSEKFKQKKKAKPISDNDIKKVKKGKIPNSNLKMRQMKEIGTVLKKLASQSNIANVDILKNIVAANSKIKMKPVNTIQDETISPHNFRGPVTLAKVGNKHVSSNKPIKKAKKAMKISTAPVKIKNKSLDEHDKSMNILNSNSSPNNVNNQNTNIGPIVIKSFTETISKFSEKTEKVNKPPKKTKTTKETNQVPLKNIASSNIKNKLNAKGKNRKQKKLNGISLNKINPENHVEGNLLLVKKKTNNRNKRSPKASELIRKSNENILQERDWMDKEDSILAGKCLFQWLILPISQQDFMRVYWEKKPLLIKRDENRNYFSELMSTADVDTMLRDNVVCFTKHLDVTSYTDGVRETHNLSGRAQPNVVWDFYSNGCSVRLLNPQIFLPKIHALNATLQEYFGCFVGANVYLTPPNSQGFAPHYDDIEAFVLQIEGKKHWKVYSPRNEQETLPRFSSPNFSQEEIGVPILDVTLEPGDMLYFPRGYIHQASTVDGEHSLHITLSAYQKTAWVDLLEKTLPLALSRAAAEDVEFRRGLPRHYLNIEHCGSDAEKMAFANTAQRLMTRLSHFLGLTLGAGVDQMGAQFMHDALPPVFTPGEKEKTSLGSGLKIEENGKLSNRVEFDMDTKVKLVRANLCRLAEEEGEVRLYHCLDNPLEYHAEEPQFLVLPQEGIRVITHLACCYPAYVQVKKLPHDNEEDLLTLISDLWDAGLLLAIRLQTSSETD